MTSPKLAKIDANIFKNMNLDVQSLIQEVKYLTGFLSFSEIILDKKFRDQQSKNKKYIFKLIDEEKDVEKPKNNSVDSFLEDSVFLTIRVKKQVYLGEAALAIYMNDISSKITTKLNCFLNQEKMHQAQQIESYTATISHEMRTPISSIIYLLESMMR